MQNKIKKLFQTIFYIIKIPIAFGVVNPMLKK